MDQREQREAMLKAREQAVQEYRRLKARERDQSPHIPQGKKKEWAFLVSF